jgi:hypothetical protein
VRLALLYPDATVSHVDAGDPVEHAVQGFCKIEV